MANKQKKQNKKKIVHKNSADQNTYIASGIDKQQFKTPAEKLSDYNFMKGPIASTDENTNGISGLLDNKMPSGSNVIVLGDINAIMSKINGFIDGKKKDKQNNQKSKQSDNDNKKRESKGASGS